MPKYICGVPGSVLLSRSLLTFFEKCSIGLSNSLVHLANSIIFKNYLDLPCSKINYKNIVGNQIISSTLENNSKNTNSKNNIKKLTYLKESIIDIDIKNKIVKTDSGILADIDLVVCATGYTSVYPFQFSYLYNYIIPVDSNYRLINKNIAFLGYNPSYNFIDNVRNRLRWYLEKYDFIDINDVNTWITKNIERKQQNKLDFMDCTYELFDFSV